MPIKSEAAGNLPAASLFTGRRVCRFAAALVDRHHFAVFGQRPEFVVHDQFELVDVVANLVEIDQHVFRVTGRPRHQVVHVVVFFTGFDHQVSVLANGLHVLGDRLDRTDFLGRQVEVLVRQDVLESYVLGFLEAGNAWHDIKKFNPFELKRSAGVGVRIFLPMIGMMGIDWGYGFDKVFGSKQYGGSQFHFILGQEF